MKKILVFINGELGLDVTRFLASQRDVTITGIVINSTSKRNSSYLPQLRKEALSPNIFEFSDNLWARKQFLEVVQNSSLAVSALFGHLIPARIISHFGANIINLHPSLLPLGRGADPIPWAIIDNQKQGVTIHVLEEELDAGPIVSQFELDVGFDMTSGQIYEMAMIKLLQLFKEFILDLPDKFDIRPQLGKMSYHKREELLSLRADLADKPNLEVEKALRIIQALTFSDGRATRLRLSSGEQWEISLSITKPRTEGNL
jgi:methionyl-tRNA formyltransferase